MRVTGWILVVMGVVGAIACVWGVFYVHDTRHEVQDSVERVGTRAMELLDVVDGKMQALPGQLNELMASDRPQPVLDKLRTFEDGLQDASEMLTSIVSLMEAAAALRPGSERPHHMRAVALSNNATQLAGMSAEVREQIENAETWTLKFQVFEELVERMRNEVHQAGKETQRWEIKIVDTLDVISVAVIVFLLWMALGQIALAIYGKRKASEA